VVIGLVASVLERTALEGLTKKTEWSAAECRCWYVCSQEWCYGRDLGIMECLSLTSRDATWDAQGECLVSTYPPTIL